MTTKKGSQILSVLAVALLLTVSAQFTNLKAEGHDGHESSGKGDIIGAWYGNFYGTPTIANYHSDGTFISHNSDSLGQGDGQKSTIMGAWVKTGPRTFRFKGIIFSLDLDGNLLAVVELGGPVEVSKDGMQMSMESNPRVFFCTANDDCPNPATDEPDFVYLEPILLEWDRIVP